MAGSFIILLSLLFCSPYVSALEIPQPDLSPSTRPVLYLLGVNCFNGRKELALTYEPGIQWALNQVNARDDILPNYELRVIWADSECEPGPAVFNMYKKLHEPPTKIILLGGGFSPVSEAIGLVSHLWNLVQVTPSSVSPALSNKVKYPLLFRINTPYKTVVEPYLAFMKEFNWKRVATIYETKEIFSQVIIEFISRLPENNISLVTSEIYAADPEVQVRNLKKQDARIIIGGFYEPTAVKVFCEAYRIGLYGPKIVWIIPGWFLPQWWLPYKSACTAEEVATSSAWALGMTGVSYNYKDTSGLAGFKPSVYQGVFIDQWMGGVFPSTGMSGPGKASDAVYAVAKGLHYADQVLRTSGSDMRLENFTYADWKIKDLIFQGMHNVSFQGIKGYVKFDELGDPVGDMKILQYIPEGLVINGFFDSLDQKFLWKPDFPIRWPGGAPPKDSTTRMTEVVFIGMNTYIVTCAIASLGMFLSLCFLVFNILYRNKRFIKMSSPMMNNVIVLGSILAYLTVFLQETSDNSILIFCKLRSYSLMLGFSIAFGALFAKTWRVYMIFTRTTKRTVLKDHQLMLIVAVLCAIDVIIAVIRELLDPLVVVVSTIGIVELDNGDTIITKKSMRCMSDYNMYFKGVIFCIKGLLLVFGAFLSWQTRKVTIPALNDSQYIGMCIYNIAVLSILGVVLSFVLTDQVNLSYMLIGGFIIFGTTITQLIIFVPKILKFKSGKVDDEEMNTMGTMNVAVNSSLSTTVETGMSEGQSHELESTKEFIEQLKKEIEALKQKKNIK